MSINQCKFKNVTLVNYSQNQDLESNIDFAQIYMIFISKLMTFEMLVDIIVASKIELYT